MTSAGNDGVSLDGAPVWPASLAADHDNVLAVGASTNTDARASFSNHGAAVTVWAPGFFVQAPVPGSTWAYKSGTSMAAPGVSGVAALVLADEPTLTPSALRARLQGTAAATAAGPRVDADAALEPNAPTLEVTGVDALLPDVPGRLTLVFHEPGTVPAGVGVRLSLATTDGTTIETLEGVSATFSDATGTLGSTSSGGDGSLAPVAVPDPAALVSLDGWSLAVDITLPLGEHALVVELVDGDGVASDGAWVTYLSVVDPDAPTPTPTTVDSATSSTAPAATTTSAPGATTTTGAGGATTTRPPTTTTIRPPTTTTTRPATTTTARVTTTTAPRATTTQAPRTTTTTPPTTPPTGPTPVSGAWRIDSISPSSGPLSGANLVTVSGNFPRDTELFVWFEGIDRVAVPEGGLSSDGRTLQVRAPRAEQLGPVPLSVRFHVDEEDVVLTAPSPYRYGSLPGSTTTTTRAATTTTTAGPGTATTTTPASTTTASSAAATTTTAASPSTVAAPTTTAAPPSTAPEDPTTTTTAPGSPIVRRPQPTTGPLAGLDLATWPRPGCRAASCTATRVG